MSAVRACPCPGLWSPVAQHTIVRRKKETTFLFTFKNNHTFQSISRNNHTFHFTSKKNDTFLFTFKDKHKMQEGIHVSNPIRQMRQLNNNCIVLWPVWPPRTIKCNSDNNNNNNISLMWEGMPAELISSFIQHVPSQPRSPQCDQSWKLNLCTIAKNCRNFLRKARNLSMHRDTVVQQEASLPS